MTRTSSTPASSSARRSDTGRVAIIGSTLAAHHRVGSTDHCRCGHVYDNDGDVVLHSALAVETALVLVDLGLAVEQMCDGVDTVLALMGR